MASQVRITPLTAVGGKDPSLGATVSNFDISRYTDADFQVLERALYTHQVLVIKDAQCLTPAQQYQLTQRFDPLTSVYGHGTDPVSSKAKSILHPDLKTVPHQPQVQVIGNGFVSGYEGLQNIQLRHPHHRTFHATTIPKEDDLDYTRFYRWHIDAALYGLAPPVATSLLAVKVPRGRRQTVRYDDGSGEELDVPLGTTAFVSGENMYNLLSDADKLFARTTKVEYAPHPYIWMSGAKSNSTGLGMVSEGKELSSEELPEIEREKIQILPLCWQNPVTHALALQIHPSAIRALHLADGSIIDDLKTVREIVYRLQRPGISPQHVYAHDWQEGDLVLFHNRGVLHSVVGAFAEDEVRLFRQCNMAASHMPIGPSESQYTEAAQVEKFVGLEPGPASIGEVAVSA